MNAWFERLFSEGRISARERAELYRLARVRRSRPKGGHSTRGFSIQQWTCFEHEGGPVLWERTAGNLWTTAGADWLLNHTLVGGTTVYLGLIYGASAPTFAIGDTMSSHSGWTEIPSADVTAGVRQTITWGSSSGGVVSNSASQVSYTIAASLVGTINVWGGFMTDNNTLSGTTGNLISEAIFDQGVATVAANNVVQVLVTVTIVAG